MDGVEQVLVGSAQLLSLPLRTQATAGGEIVVGEVGEHVEADAVRLEAGVVLVDGAAGLLEHRVPALLLSDGGVGLVVLGLPLHEHPPGLRLPVRYDRHIRIRRQRQQQQPAGAAPPPPP